MDKGSFDETVGTGGRVKGLGREKRRECWRNWMLKLGVKILSRIGILPSKPSQIVWRSTNAFRVQGRTCITMGP